MILLSKYCLHERTASQRHPHPSWLMHRIQQSKEYSTSTRKAPLKEFEEVSTPSSMANSKYVIPHAWIQCSWSCRRLGERFINQIDGLVIWASWLYLNSHVGKLTPENYRYEYVRQFEKNERLLQNTWMVIRLDGRGFTKLTARYNFQKPNDERALRLMNEAAMNVVMELPDVVLAYGQSDEYR